MKEEEWGKSEKLRNMNEGRGGRRRKSEEDTKMAYKIKHLLQSTVDKSSTTEERLKEQQRQQQEGCLDRTPARQNENKSPVRTTTNRTKA
jgi:hypothetical protein